VIKMDTEQRRNRFEKIKENYVKERTKGWQ